MVIVYLRKNKMKTMNETTQYYFFLHDEGEFSFSFENDCDFRQFAGISSSFINLFTHLESENNGKK